MIHEALDATETFRERKEMRVLEKTPRPGEISLENDRDHSAERAHLFLCQLVLRMLLESRVINFFNLRLLLEPARNLERVFAMPLHSQGERLQSAERQETIERPRDRADGVLQKRDLIT